MTLRRLNLKIQGFPESYASEPSGEDMVVGEPHHRPSAGGISPPAQQQLHSQHDDGLNNVPDNSSITPLPTHGRVNGALGSSIRSSPIAEGTITGAA